MSFIAENPLSLPEIQHTPSTPQGTMGLFAKKDGFYQVDSKNNEKKIATMEDIDDGTAAYVEDLNITGDILEVTKGDGSKTELSLPTGGGGGSVTVDDVLSETSTNPVQNKVITEAINDINENAITDMYWMGAGDGWELHFRRKDGEILFLNTRLASSEQVQEAIDSAVGGVEESIVPLISGIWALSPGVKNVYHLLFSNGETSSSVVEADSKEINFASKEYVDEAINDIEGSSITVDDALSETSENPVQNKVITNTINNCLITASRFNDEEIVLHSFAEPSKVTIPAASPKYVDDAIGDIETALENVIAKYGLGGDSV